MEIDKTGLDSRLFDALSVTSRRRYAYAYNLQTGVSRWSKHIAEDFDMPGEYILNALEIWGSLVHPEDRAKYFEDFQAIYEGKKDDHVMDYRVMDKKGNYVMCSCRGTISRGENGEPDLFAGSIVNYGIAELVDPTTNL